MEMRLRDLVKEREIINKKVNKNNYVNIKYHNTLFCKLCGEYHYKIPCKNPKIKRNMPLELIYTLFVLTFLPKNLKLYIINMVRLYYETQIENKRLFLINKKAKLKNLENRKKRLIKS